MSATDKIIVKASAYFEEERVTHYISAISLGAHLQSEKQTETNKKGGGASLSAGSDPVGEVRGLVKVSIAEGKIVDMYQKQGDVAKVKEGEGECRIDYKSMEVFHLLRPELNKLREVLASAIKFYLNQKSEYN